MPKQVYNSQTPALGEPSSEEASLCLDCLQCDLVQITKCVCVYGGGIPTMKMPSFFYQHFKRNRLSSLMQALLGIYQSRG